LTGERLAGTDSKRIVSGWVVSKPQVTNKKTMTEKIVTEK
jgi:hypothetical protein